jgi:hypothetical protein
MINVSRSLRSLRWITSYATIAFVTVTSVSFGQILVDPFTNGSYNLIHNGSGGPVGGNAQPVPASQMASGSVLRLFGMQNFDTSGNSDITAKLNPPAGQLSIVSDGVGANSLVQLYYDHNGPQGLERDLNVGVGTQPTGSGIIVQFGGTATSTIAMEMTLDKRDIVVCTCVPPGTWDRRLYGQQRAWFAGNTMFFPFADFNETFYNAVTSINDPLLPGNGTAFPSAPSYHFDAISYLLNVKDNDHFDIDEIRVGVPAAGTTSNSAILPTVIPGPSGTPNIFRFANVHRQRWFDPPMAYGYEYEMTSNSLFTLIALPEFLTEAEVYVDNVLLGTFDGMDRIRFADYAAQLGSLLVFDAATLMAGVRDFRIEGLRVDATDPLALPLYIDANTELISFDQIPLVPEPGATSLVFFAVVSTFLASRTNLCRRS